MGSLRLVVALSSACVLAGACRNGGNATTSGAGATGGSGGTGATGSDAAAGGDAAPPPDGPNKTIVLALAPADGTPLDGVASVVVTVTENGNARMQTFDHDRAKAIDAGAPLELSLAVAPSDSGMVILVVDARDAGGCKLATALTNVLLVEDAIIHASVSLQRLDECAAGDGGAADVPPANDGGPAPFPGCDPLETTCGGDMTCEVRCASKTAACTAGGSAFHGATCASSADCAAGAECVDYASAGCAAKICRRFCAEDVNCPQPLAAVLPRNTCAVPLACAGTATAYRTCSVSCDPTSATLANGDTTCPAELDCLLLDLDHADCGCFPRTHIKAEGETCGPLDHCSPGLFCHAEGATSTCRGICLCNVEMGACAAVIDNACPKAGTHCAPVPGGTVYGVCLP